MTPFNLLYLCIIIGLMASCKKDEIGTYTNDAASVRFLNSVLNQNETQRGGNLYNSGDELYNMSFSFLEDVGADWHDLDIPVALVGLTAGYDRQISYTILKSTAPAESYEIIDATIPADSIYGFIRIRLYNLEELNDSTYELNIQLSSSNDLAAGPKAYTKAHIAWNNQILAPSNANHIRTYNMLVAGMASFVSTSLNAYSPNALRAIVAATGWDDWDDYDVHGTQYNNATTYNSYKYLPRYSWIYTDLSYMGYAAILADWLKAYEEEHGTPLLHDAGTLKGQPVQARSY